MNIILICVLVVLITLYIIFIIRLPHKKDKAESFKSTKHHSFQIKNYLIGRPIKIEVENETGEKLYISDVIPARGSIGVSESDRLKSFGGGNLIKIYTIENDNKPLLYSKIYIDTGKKEFIKSLYIGQVTTRFSGTTDVFRQTVTNSVAVNGLPWVKIHNLTDQVIRLNGKIQVEPHSTVRYQGYLNSGVALGTYFKNDEGIYPEFQYLKPQSDIYYGLVSDLEQSLNGPLHYGDDFSDIIDPGQTLFPFVEGQY